MVTGTVGEPTEDEHGNLMWLVDFKLDFLTDIDKEDDTNNNNNNEEPTRKKQKTESEQPSGPPPPPREVRSNDNLRPPTIRPQYYEIAAAAGSSVQCQAPVQLHVPHTSQVTSVPCQVAHYPTPQSSVASVPGYHPGYNRPHVSSAKPNYTYTDLITLALKDKTALTVSGIYQWIT